MNTTGWLDEFSPLSFQLSYLVEGPAPGDAAAQPAILSAFQPGDTFRVRLPAGLAEAGWRVRLRVAARNALGAETAEPALSAVVVVTPQGAAPPPPQVAASAAAAAAEGSLVGLVDNAVALVHAAAAVLNRASAAGADPSKGSPGADGGWSLPPPPPAAAGGAEDGEAARAAVRASLSAVLFQAAAAVGVVAPGGAAASSGSALTPDVLLAVASAVAAVVAYPAEVPAEAQAAALDILGPVAAGGALGRAAVSPATAERTVQALAGVAQAAMVASMVQEASAPPPSAGSGDASGASSAASATLQRVVQTLETLSGSMAAQLSVPGEAAATASSQQISLAVRLDGVDSGVNSAAAASALALSRLTTHPFTSPGALAAFDPLPPEAAAQLAAGAVGVRTAGVGTSPPGILSQFLSTAFSPYPEAGGAGGGALPLARLVFRGAAAGPELPLSNLSAPIRLTMPAPAPSGTRADSTVLSCRFWDAAAQTFSTGGCLALPSPRPRGHATEWLDPSDALQRHFVSAAGDDGQVAAAAPPPQQQAPVPLAALWGLSGPLLDGCTLQWLDCGGELNASLRSGAQAAAQQRQRRQGGAAFSLDPVWGWVFSPGEGDVFLDPTHPLESPIVACPNASSAPPGGLMRVFVGEKCLLRAPGNDAGCWWVAESQAFEGPGCEESPTLSCSCRHLTDFVPGRAPRVRDDPPHPSSSAHCPSALRAAARAPLSSSSPPQPFARSSCAGEGGVAVAHALDRASRPRPQAAQPAPAHLYALCPPADRHPRLRRRRHLRAPPRHGAPPLRQARLLRLRRRVVLVLPATARRGRLRRGWRAGAEGHGAHRSPLRPLQACWWHALMSAGHSAKRGELLNQS